MDEKRETRLEDWRQLEHLLPVGFAFLLPYLPYWGVIVLAVLAIFHALFFSPWLVGVTTRNDEAARGFSPGKLLYAFSVLALVLLFADRLYIAAGVWAILSVGDSVSNVIGRRWGKRRMPYNSSKSWIGFFSFWGSGSVAATTLIWWNWPPTAEVSLTLIVGCSVIGALVCAGAESLPPVIDDNLAICWLGGVALALLFAIPDAQPQASAPWWQAAVVNGLAALVATGLNWLSRRGTLAAFLFGLLVYTSMGAGGYVVLFSFLVIGSLTTRAGFEQKKRLRISQGESGQRGVSNILANGLVPLLAALVYSWLQAPYLAAAFAAAVATATFDTVSTEIGQWLGRHPRNPVTFRRVRVGTQGAVSLEGTLAGAAGAVLVGLTAVVTGWLPYVALPIIFTGALSGAFFESLLAAWGRFDFPLSDEVLNLYSTLFGACTAALLWVNLV